MHTWIFGFQYLHCHDLKVIKEIWEATNILDTNIQYSKQKSISLRCIYLLDLQYHSVYCLFLQAHPNTYISNVLNIRSVRIILLNTIFLDNGLLHFKIFTKPRIISPFKTSSMLKVVFDNTNTQYKEIRKSIVNSRNMLNDLYKASTIFMS